MQASQLDQLKAQAEILLPLMKGFKTELGEDRAYAIARKAMEKFYLDIGKQIGALYPGNAIEQIASLTPYYADDDALKYDELKKTADIYEYKVTKCRFAEHYKELGETELGYMFVCAGDLAIATGISPDLKLTRSQTIMQGADHCHFCYKLKKC